MRLYTVAIILAILFVITYDPKSRTLEKYISPLTAGHVNAAAGPTPADGACKHPHFQARNFGGTGYDCPKRKSKMGGIHSG